MAVNHLQQALSIVWRSSRKWTIALLITQLLQAVLPLLQLYLIKLIVDAVTLSETAQLKEVLIYVACFGGVQLAISILQNYQQLISETQQQLVADYLSAIIIDKATGIDLSYYENPEYHDTFHRAQNQAMHRPVQVLRNLSDLLRNVFLLLSISGLLLFLHWAIALILVAFAFPVAAVKWYYSRKLFEWNQNSTHLEREAFYLNRVLTSDTYAKEVRIFNLKLPLKKEFLQLRERLFSEKLKIGKQRARSGVLARGAEILAMVLIYGFVVWRAVEGNITVGDLVMYFQAFQKGQGAVQQLLTAGVGLYNNRLFLTHLFELLKVESLLEETQSPSPIPDKKTADLALKKVHFTYPNTDREVLHDISLTFKKGQVIALVGENGSGKTTLVKLLCRLYDPTQGSISFGGVDIRQFSLQNWRRRISVIYQDFARYFFSVLENIKIADWEMENTEEQIQRAAQKSGAADFIKKMPKKYQQKLGKRFRSGIELSGGQWQKIALTRAFYKNADLIVLDEPSSAIDPLAEAEIFREFRQLASDKILVLVTHRLYNLRMVDKIVVMREGRVVEEGTHEELIRMEGLYKTMFEKTEGI